MDKNTLIKVTNRFSGNVGYYIPDLQIKRRFVPRETKEITFEELEKLSYIPGGMKIIEDYLVVKNVEALKQVAPKVEPEYFYEEEDIKKLLLTGSNDQLLDCLDFAPDGVIEMVKSLAVSLPLDNVSKRDIIKDKLGFDITRAIEIQNTKYDGDSDAASESTGASKRRSAPINETINIEQPAESKRRVAVDNEVSWKDIIQQQ